VGFCSDADLTVMVNPPGMTSLDQYTDYAGSSQWRLTNCTGAQCSIVVLPTVLLCMGMALVVAFSVLLSPSRFWLPCGGPPFG